jgi:hypothetical protein
MRLLLNSILAPHDFSRPPDMLIRDIYGPLYDYCSEEWERSGKKNLPRTLGQYLCFEMQDSLRAHAGSLEENDTYSVDMFHGLCVILGDEELRNLFSKYISPVEETLGREMVRRKWLDKEFETYSEDGVKEIDEFQRNAEWEALKATPFAQYNVSIVYDRDNGVYEKPLNSIYRVDYDDGRIVRVALRSETTGVILNADGTKSEDLALFKLLWNNPENDYKCLEKSNKKPKV